MDSAHVFISRTTADDGFVKRLREALTARGLTVWDDARYLRGGDELWPEVARAIEAAQYFIVVFSQQSLSSNWVFKEFGHARQIEAQRKAEGKHYRVIPLLLDDAELGTLRWVFAEERAAIRVSSKPGGLTEKMKDILAALGRELPADAAPPPAVEENPFAELLFELRRLTIETVGDKRRAKAEATLVYQPPVAVTSGVAAREVKSDPFFFTSPLGPIEADDLGWYLEKFYQWPVGQFKARGDCIAKQLPEWGRLLYQAALEDEAAREPLRAWLDIAGKAERRFSIEVSDKLPKGSPPEAAAAAKEAATLLLSLPWELLHDERGYLFHGKHPVRVRRRLPNHIKLDAVARQLPIRVLRRREYDEQGNTPEDIAELVEAVNRHARALTLLAREVKLSGVRATTDNLRPLMAKWEKEHPGDRENSLYASVELSLRRLPPETRKIIKVLGVFHGGFDINVLRLILGVDKETVASIYRQLIGVGLAEMVAYGHLRLDPALSSCLLREMDDREQAEVKSRWAEAMKRLTGFLYQQQSENTELSARLTLLELPNLMAMLAWVEDKLTPKEVVELAHSVEELLSQLGRPQALVQATKVREQAARKLGGWGSAQYLTGSALIDRLVERGELPKAYATAQRLLQRCLAAGDDAYPGAAYNIANAHWSLGRVLQLSGSAEAALKLLVEAERRFQILAKAGNANAERMASSTIGQIANCLTDLGRLDEAAAMYEESIKRDEKFGDQRGIAVHKGNLGTVRMLQGRFAEALETYAEVRDIFEILGEPISVADSWHRIGMVYRQSRQFEQAEQAYRQALAVRV